ncbi:hypothetical protein CSUI_004455, partial [Cystoisospora suis]
VVTAPPMTSAQANSTDSDRNSECPRTQEAKQEGIK